MKVSVNSILYRIFLFFCFFPFVGFNIGTDTQPFALIMGFVVLVVNQTKLRRKETIGFYFKRTEILLFCVLILTILSLCIYTPSAVLKRLFSYFSLLILPFSTYIAIRIIGLHKFHKFVKFAIWVWGLAAVIQIVVDKYFFNFLIPLTRTSLNRGVCSLASEPSFYGYVCFFLFLLALDFKQNRIFYLIFIAVQALVFAQSAVGSIYFILLGVSFLIYLLAHIKKSNILKALGLIILTFVVVLYITKAHADSRIVFLFTKIFENGRNILKIDASVSQRFDAIMVSFSKYGIPQLFGGVTIMSGYGGLFYDFGFFSIILIRAIYRCIKHSDSMGTVLAVSITISMFSAIQLSSPFLGLYLGYCLWKLESKERVILGIGEVLSC